MDRAPPALTPSGPGSKLLESITSFSLLLGPLVTVILLLIFSPAFLNLLVKFVSFRLLQFHIKIRGMQRSQPILGTDPERITPEVTLGPLYETG